MKLSILIVNWHSADYVRKCLLSISRNPPVASYEVIVIDNASFDSCEEILGREFPWVQFLQSAANFGFARANNLAAEQAKGEALLFLNPDTEVYDGAIQRLLDVFDTYPDAGAIGARLLNSDGSLQVTSIQAFPTILNQFLDSNVLRGCQLLSPVWRNRPLSVQCGVVGGVEAISGACLLTSARNFVELGRMNESLFMYSEDTDYCFAAQQAGLVNYYVPSAVVVHHGGKSSGGPFSSVSAVNQQQSIWLFLRQRRSRKYAAAFRIVVGFKAVIRILLLAVAIPLWLTASRFTTANRLNKWKAVFLWAVGSTTFVTGARQQTRKTA